MKQTDVPEIENRILREDNHLIAVNKLAGEISQGDKSGDDTLGDRIVDYLKRRDAKQGNVYLVPVHRLDRPVSGVLLFAKTGKANSRMNALFRGNLVKKLYWAIVAEPPEPLAGTLSHHLVRNRRINKSFANAEPSRDSQTAELRYSVVAFSDRYCLLEIVMSTGRHHQIRAQLSAIGCPIKGDLKYGAPRSNRDGGISLHARSVEFEHPIRKQIISITAPAPTDVLWAALAGEESE